MSYSNSNRFVIEDSIAKVTTDGEPHEMMTLVAGLSGMLAAVIVLAILIALIGCRDQQDGSQNDANPQTGTEGIAKQRIHKSSSLLPLFFKQDSTTSGEDSPQIVSISIIPDERCNENLAFTGSASSLYQKGDFVANVSTEKF